MSNERSCANCGVALEPDAPEGSICVDCAQAANGASEDFTPTVAADGATPAPSTGSASIRANAQPLFERIGDFEVLDKLGQGGMGAVYRARQVSLDRLVALKILPSQFEEEESFLGRFRREATVAASLNHPNLVRVYASGEADGVHYIAMELVEGENLRQFLRRAGPMAPLDALRICLGVARGLQCGWNKAQLIHRDIKPSNIYLSQSGEVKLGDLGLAKSLSGNTTGITHTGTALGTPHYVSPEQARGDKTIDCRADIYSLGCTLYEMLTGATPYKGSDPLTVMTMHLNSPPPAILKVLPQCPVPVARLVSKMLQKKPHERHQSYDELVAAMESAIDQLENPNTGPSAVVQAWKEIGKAEQGFLPVRGTSRPPTSPVERPASATRLPAAAASAPRSRKAYQWFALAAATIIIAAACFIWLPSSRAPATGRGGGHPNASAPPPGPTGATANPATLKAPASSTQDEFEMLSPVIAARATKLWDDPGTLTKDERIRWQDGVILLDGANMNGPSGRDAILRVSIRGDSVSPVLGLRRGATDKCRLEISFPEEKVTLFTKTTGGVVREWKLPRAIGPAEWLNIELRLVGNRCSVWAGGRMLGSVEADSFPPEGRAMLSAGHSGRFRNVTYVPLDGLPGAEALKLAGGVAAPATAVPPAGATAERWEDLLADPQMQARIKRNAGAAEVSTQAYVERGRGRDGAIRSRLAFTPDLAAANFQLIACKTGDGFYIAHVTSDGLGGFVQYVDNVNRRTWPVPNETRTRLPQALQTGELFTLELRVLGENVMLKMNGQTVSEGRDPRGGRGAWGVGAGPGSVILQSLEYSDLSSASPAVSAPTTPAAATKEQPFINSLGMKFVPVPITGGPTGGQRVLFSIWETRVQDYELFAKETGREWPKPDFEQTPTHPALNVTWDDARLFCNWLTNHARQRGEIGPNESYRLPSDHEWSCAAGIGDREDPAKPPMEKEGALPDSYVWGQGWPPPAGAGNFKFDGPDDRFPDSAPVGSFAAQRFGLYDLAGNAWEWCTAPKSGVENENILRGGSYLDNVRSVFVATHRIQRPNSYRSPTTGFRVVLAPVAESRSGAAPLAALAANTPATATKEQPFVNSLGMKFVPVPIIGGPTGGQRVLFSIWETRMQDYEAFAKETGREWPKPPFEQTPTHPAVMLTWDDATAFCAWLTERERKAARLDANELYRLPSDHEWSCAAGLGEHEDAAALPKDKGEKREDKFPWGDFLPPPRNAGNFASDELRPMLAAGKYAATNRTLDRYADGFGETAPVGSFDPDRFGLYDLAGNAFEYCEDWLDAARQDRVKRGSSWSSGFATDLRFSRRQGQHPSIRGPSNGFRVVLARVQK